MKFNKKDLILVAPVVILMVSPWLHKVIYENLLLAWPDVDKTYAHVFIIVLTVMGSFISLLVRF